jgi:uncharacterized membrane protein
MNSLTKAELLMGGFILLVIGSFILDLLLILPALILFALQVMIFRGELKKEYPEDWAKYSLVFLVYEVMLISLVFFMVSSSSFGLAFINQVFIAALFVIAVTIALRFLAARRHCYGTVIFSTKGWVGVSVKPDLFTKVREANYAVENPLGIKVSKGERVKLRARKQAVYELIK